MLAKLVMEAQLFVLHVYKDKDKIIYFKQQDFVQPLVQVRILLIRKYVNHVYHRAKLVLPQKVTAKLVYLL